MWTGLETKETQVLHLTDSDFVSRTIFDQLMSHTMEKVLRRRPTRMVVLTASGLATAEYAAHLGIPTMGLPTYKQGDDYLVGDLVALGDLTDHIVAVGDDGSDRGELLPTVAEIVSEHGGNPFTFALVANQTGRQPDVIGAICNGKPPKFYWKRPQEPVGTEALAQIFCAEVLEPNTLVVVGEHNFTKAAELSYVLGISGRYVVGLPALEDGQPDFSWVTLGDFTDRRVLVLGNTNASLDEIVRRVAPKAAVVGRYKVVP